MGKLCRTSGPTPDRHQTDTARQSVTPAEVSGRQAALSVEAPDDENPLFKPNTDGFGSVSGLSGGLESYEDPASRGGDDCKKTVPEETPANEHVRDDGDGRGDDPRPCIGSEGSEDPRAADHDARRAHRGQERERGELAALLEDPPYWLADQLAKCREDPERWLSPTSSTIAAKLYGSAARWGEVKPILETCRGGCGSGASRLAS